MYVPICSEFETFGGMDRVRVQPAACPISVCLKHGENFRWSPNPAHSFNLFNAMGDSEDIFRSWTSQALVVPRMHMHALAPSRTVPQAN